jgi:hypothetical protein
MKRTNLVLDGQKLEAVWHRDRNFTTIARYTRLRAVGKYLT